MDTFLVTVYCLIDDVYRRYAGPVRAHLPGRPGELSDSEVLTLAVLAQWQPRGSERQFIAWAATHWRAYFPRLLSQSAFNRRARQLYGVLAQLSGWIRTAVEDQVDGRRVYEIIDGVPVPLMRRCRGQRRHSFGTEADFGRGGSDKELYYGVKLLAAVDQAGFVTGWVVGPASTEEHWLAEALFMWRQQPGAPAPSAAALADVLGPTHHYGGQRHGPRGPMRGRLSAGPSFAGPTLADLGFQGAAWRRHWRADWGAAVLLKNRDHLQLLGEPTPAEVPTRTDLLGTADPFGGQDQRLQPCHRHQLPARSAHIRPVQPPRLICITRIMRGVGAGRSAQRGTSGATTGPRGAAGPHNPEADPARSHRPNPEEVRLLPFGGGFYLSTMLISTFLTLSRPVVALCA